MNILLIIILLFAAICKLCRVLLSSPVLTLRTQKTETVADEPLAEVPSPPSESSESERSLKSIHHKKIECMYMYISVQFLVMRMVKI